MMPIQHYELMTSYIKYKSSLPHENCSLQLWWDWKGWVIEAQVISHHSCPISNPFSWCNYKMHCIQFRYKCQNYLTVIQFTQGRPSQRWPWCKFDNSHSRQDIITFLGRRQFNQNIFPVLNTFLYLCRVHLVLILSPSSLRRLLRGKRTNTAIFWQFQPSLHIHGLHEDNFCSLTSDLVRPLWLLSSLLKGCGILYPAIMLDGYSKELPSIYG